MDRDVRERFERIEKDLAEAAAGHRTHSLAMAELDEHLTRLAAAQIVTEQKLQGLIENLRRGGNGKPSATS